MMLKLALLFCSVIFLEKALAQDICLGEFALAHRTDSISCWAKYPISDQQNLCIPFHVWMRQFHQERSSLSLCGNWNGKWKAFSPAVNRASQKPKKIFMRWVAADFPPETVSNRIRIKMEFIRERCSEALKPADSLGILRHLLLGEETTRGSVYFLQNLGIMHLANVSGMHLYFLTLGIERLVFTLSGGLKLARCFSLVIWTLIWLLNGMRPGMLRPWVIIILRQSSRWLGFRWTVLAPFFLSLVLDWIYSESSQWWSTRFYMVAWVTVCILAISNHRGGLISRIFYFSFISWVISIPENIFKHGFVTPFTPFFGLLTEPFSCWVLLPSLLLMALLTALGIWEGAGVLAQALANITHGIVFFLGSGMVQFHGLWMVSWGAFLGGGVISALLLFFPRSRRMRMGIGFALLILMIRIVTWVDPSVGPVQRIEQLDVGQGDSALVWLHDSFFPEKTRAGLIDAGSEKAFRMEDWLQFFALRQIPRLSWIALSHLDEDHMGGVFHLSRLIPIGCVMTSQEELSTPRGVQFAKRLREDGVRVFSWDDQLSCQSDPFLILKPTVAHGGARKKANEHMSGFMIPLQSGKIFISLGDADQKQELQFLPTIQRKIQELAPGVPHLWLKVSHHGSKSSSSLAFIQALRQWGLQEAWISAGEGNYYGHPTVDILERFLSLGIALRRTDREGGLQLE